jgi:hypothetical protein
MGLGQSKADENPFGIFLDQTLEIQIRLDEPGIWSLRYTNARDEQSNTLTATVR